MQTLANCLKGWKSSAGLEELWSYSRNVAFIHDDSLPELLDPEDVVSYHPMLLRPDCVVVPDVDILKGAFGQKMEERLESITGLCAASGPTPSSLRNVALNGFDRTEDRIMIQKCRSTSVFQCDRLDLRRYSFNHVPPIIELQTRDNKVLQNRVEARESLNRAKIPTPYGRVLDAPEQLKTFIDSYNYPIAVRTSSRTWKISNRTEYQHFVENHPAFPIWVEKWLASLYSPNAQVLRVKGRVYPLFVSRQLLNGIVHVGNTIGDLPAHVTEKCIDLTIRFAEYLDDYSGIIGIDFIVTASNDILAVDVNARFNSSTIPFWWLLTSGNPKKSSIASFRQRRGKCLNLDNLATTRSRASAFNYFSFSPILSTPFKRVTGYHELLWR